MSQLQVCLEGKCHCYLLVRGQLFSRSVVSDSLRPRGLQHAGNAAQHPTGLRAGPRLRNTCPQMPAGYRLRNPGTELETVSFKGKRFKGLCRKTWGTGGGLVDLRSHALPRTGSTMRAEQLGKQISRQPSHTLSELRGLLSTLHESERTLPSEF